MTKSTSIAIICVICAIALFFGVCSCLPGGLEYGNYNVYNAPINLIQHSNLFGDTVVASYKVKLDEGANINDVASAIRSRLGDMYGRYFCNVKAEGDKITVTVPRTVNEENVSAESILSTVSSVGKVEICNGTSYSESEVVLTAEHVKSMSIQRIANGSNSWRIVDMKLTKEGRAIAEEKLTVSTSQWSACFAIDGNVSNYIAYTSNGNLQVYASSNADCHRIIGLVKSGSLGATLTATDTENVKGNGGLIFAIAFAAIVLASWVFYAVRYKTLAIAGVLSQLIAIVAFIMFAGMVSFSLLNVASAIGLVLGYGLMSCFTCLVFEKIRTYVAEKTFNSSRHIAFIENNKWNCIVHAIVLVVGIVLWLIPTGVTIPLGNALVYSAVLSFGVTMGLNRLFTALVYPLGKDDAASYGIKAK